MKKYLRAMICLIFSLIKFSAMKIFYYRMFDFSIFNIISPFTEIEIGKGAKLSLGKMVKMKSGSKLRARNNAQLHIGNNTSLNNGCVFTAHEKIVIGNDVQFGPNVFIYDHDHDFRSIDGLKNLNYKTTPVEIGDNVWIGANVIILKGTKIGDNCVVGAGSVLKGHYDKNSIIIQPRETIISEYNFD